MVTDPDLRTMSNGENARILVVEDEPLVRELICTQLTQDGSVPYGASTGEEALALIDREQFDLILLDIRLPAYPESRPAVRSGRAATYRSSSLRRRPASRNGWRASTPAPTTTSSSRSRSWS